MGIEWSKDFLRQINEEEELTTVVHLIVQEVKRLLEADGAAVFFFHQARCELWSPVKVAGQVLRLDARLGVAGACVAGRQAINVDSAQHDQRFYSGIDSLTKRKTRTILAVPLTKPDGELVGVLEAVNKRKGVFTARDEQLASAIAAKVADPLGRFQVIEQLRFQQQRLQEENDKLWAEVDCRFSTQNLIGASSQMQQVVRIIDQIRESSVDVLITGENGTGKELVAKAIHYNSPRGRRPLIALNCAALPDTLVESELFGIKKGVATDVEARTGKFEAAHGGSIFLDEIGDLTLGSQAKILRVLQERAVERVGEHKPVPIDVRVLAATNANLEQAIKKGTFREDLFFRLNVLRIRTPALRDIPDDIPLFANYFLEKYCREFKKEPKRFSSAAIDCCRTYAWPGNVRELENEVKRMVVVLRRTTIRAEDLEEKIRVDEPTKEGDLLSGYATLPQAVEALERRMIQDAYAKCRYNQVQTAKYLGLSRQGLIKKMKRYQIGV